MHVCSVYLSKSCELVGKISQYKKQKPLKINGLFLKLWSWRDSNPRPNKQYVSFLHAYSAFGFRCKTDSKQPILHLSPEVFDFQPEPLKAYFCFSMPPNPKSQKKTLVRHLVSLLHFGKNANLTKLRIKQQEQTLRCQLRFTARD